MIHTRIKQSISQTLSASLCLLPLLAQHSLASSADPVQPELSFGNNGHHVWTSDHRHVEGWTLNGSPGHHPELMSDRIIVTPPYPGNIRGSIWANQPERDDVFNGVLEFRVSGPDHGGGNLQLWYVKDKAAVGESSIYTVGKFDGLAIVVDSATGQGGSIRGFLNDGSTSYRDHHHVDALPFGHCTYPYRNTGHYLKLEVRQTKNDLEVLLDGHRCFQTNKVKLQNQSYFGITAASAEQPDSIEVASFVARGPTQHTGSYASNHDPTHHYQAANDAHAAANQHPMDTYNDNQHGREHKDPNDPYAGQDWQWVTESDHIADQAASDIKGADKQFEDLHARVQLIGHQADNIYHDLSLLKEEHERMHASLAHMLDRIEGMVNRVKNDVETKEFKENLAQLSRLVADSHHDVMSGLPLHVQSVMQTSSPRFGFFVFIIIASQAGLLASYLIYQARLNKQPKKYL